MGSEKLLCLLLLLSAWDALAELLPTTPLPEAESKCVFQALPSEVIDRLLSESNATLSRLEFMGSLSIREEAHVTTSCKDSPSLNSFSKLLLLFLDKVEKEQDRLGREVTALKEALRDSQQKTPPPDSQCTQETQHTSSSTEALLTAVLQLQQDVRALRLQPGGPNGQDVGTTQPHHHGGSCYQFSDKPRDCNELALQGKNESGVYVIYPYRCRKDVGVRVWCDMEGEDGEGGWTVVLSRRPLEGDQVNFNRGWRDYRIGFGDPETEQWIGNKVLHEMTSNAKQMLRVNMVDWDGRQRYAEYQTFLVEDEIGEYRLHLGGFRGDAGDAFSYHSNMRFTTSDRDNDLHDSNCAQLFDGGFWYNKCHQVSATSNLLEKQKSTKGINWNTWYADRTTLKEMYFKVKTEPCDKIN